MILCLDVLIQYQTRKLPQTTYRWIKKGSLNDKKIKLLKAFDDGLKTNKYNEAEIHEYLSAINSGTVKEYRGAELASFIMELVIDNQKGLFDLFLRDYHYQLSQIICFHEALFMHL